MPRPHDNDRPGRIWHIVHHCHDQASLLRFKRDRLLWQRWLLDARRRLGLQVLDYSAGRDRVHLLVQDRGAGEVDRSVALVAWHMGQSYNGRHHRRGAFWAPHYHATAVESDEALRHCLVHLALNMVWVGAVSHPRDWDTCGYQEIQTPRPRLRIVDTAALMKVLKIDDPRSLKTTHRHWVEEALAAYGRRRVMEPAESGLRLEDEPLRYSARFDAHGAPTGA